jgi:glucose/mannose-6-phosphate isomerase
VRVDDTVLDDVGSIEAGDPAGMLPKVGSAGAQVRHGVAAAAEGVASLAAGVLGTARPRAVVVAGMGGSGIAGDVLASVAGPDCPVPVLLHRGYGLPGWVATTDLVVAVSASGSTEETLSAVEEARRRGTRLLTVGAPESPLAALCRAAGGLHFPVDSAGWPPRARIWALSVPVLAAADALGLAHVPAEVFESTADLLDAIAERCHPSVGSIADPVANPVANNPAKALALQLAGRVPVLWGSTELAGVAARRFGCQLNENAKVPAVTGWLPEADHNQVMAFDGPYGADIRLVVLRDSEEHPQLSRRRTVSVEIAESRGVEVSEILAEGSHPLHRLASLIAVSDHASVYLALVLGIDPTPIGPINYLKERIATTDAREVP